MNLLHLFCFWGILAGLFEVLWLCLRLAAKYLSISKSQPLKLYWTFVLTLLSAPIVDIGLPRCSTEALFSACIVAVAHIWITATNETEHSKPVPMPGPNPKRWRGL